MALITKEGQCKELDNKDISNKVNEILALLDGYNRVAIDRVLSDVKESLNRYSYVLPEEDAPQSSHQCWHLSHSHQS